MESLKDSREPDQNLGFLLVESSFSTYFADFGVFWGVCGGLKVGSENRNMESRSTNRVEIGFKLYFSTKKNFGNFFSGDLKFWSI